MNKNYPLFKYISGDSKVHLMNSKLKILWCILSFIIIILLNDYISIGIFSMLLITVAIMSKIKLDIYIYNLCKVWILYLIAFVITYFITFNMNLSIYTTVKVVLFILQFLILTFTTSLSEIAWGIECLFSKLKKIHVPVSKIALKTAMYIKFVATVFEQSRTIRKSMAYRGVAYKNNSHVAFKSMFIPVIRLSYKLSKRTVAAMKLRFYGYSNKRTNYHENKTTAFDKILIFCDIVILYVTLWLGWV